MYSLMILKANLLLKNGTYLKANLLLKNGTYWLVIRVR